MSQTPPIAYFVVGLRLRQASVLCSTQQAVYAKTSVLAALTQLSDAVIRLFQVVEPPAITQQQVLGLIQNCWNLVQQYADGDDYFLRTAYGACQGYLQTLETSLRNLTNVNAGQSPRVNNWYELGWEVANGRNEIERKIIQLDDDPDPIRRAGIYSETDRGWSFARPERIRELLSNLDISVGQVMPTHTGEILCPIPVLDQQLGGWHQIEAGISVLEVVAGQADARHRQQLPQVCDPKSIQWRNSYFGLMFDDKNHRVRRAGKEDEVDLSSSQLRWHLLQLFATSEESLVSRDQLRMVWRKHGRADDPENGTINDGVGELSNTLKPLALRIKASRGLGWKITELSPAKGPSQKKERKPAKRRGARKSS